MEESQSSRTPRGKSFSIFEDETLCRSWLEVSQDPLLDTKQMQLGFWDRVLDKYNNVHGDQSNRTASSLLNRWCSIRIEVNKFCGYLAHIEAKHLNRVIEVNKIVEAKLLFREIHKKHFLFEHCWNILNGNGEWYGLTTIRKQCKKNPTLNDLAPSTSTPTQLAPATSTQLVSFPSTSSHLVPSTSAPSTPNTPASLDSDIDLEQRMPGEGSKRLVCVNDEKEPPKKKRDCEDILETLALQNREIVDLLQNMSSHKAEREQKKSEYKSAQLEVLKMMNEREQRREEDEIMSKDTSNMNDMQKAYYDRRRSEILAQMNIDISSP